ncbi:MAG: aspartate kinase, partial [Clostridium sp.]|nr:aspartate kinase [Clostridium sp.]
MKTVVTKFGGSSLASARQFEKVKKIIMADEARKYVVPSAPGKRDKKDTKITDLLYMCHSHVEIGISHEDVFKYIYDRYTGIVSELGLNFDIKKHLDIVKKDL